MATPHKAFRNQAYTKTRSEVLGAKEERAKTEADKIQKKIKGLTVPELHRKMLEHVFRENYLTLIRRGQVPIKGIKKTIWLCVQETRSIHFVNLIRGELKSRGIDPDLYRPTNSEVNEIIAEQKKLVEEGMRKAKGN